MKNSSSSFISRVTVLLRKPGLWIIIILFITFTIPHYIGSISSSAGLGQSISELGVTRHTLERILFLVPMIWSGFLFGIKGAITAAIIALACMLPRAIIISDYKLDALLETGLITIIGFTISIVSAYFIRMFNRERKYMEELEIAHRELVVSEDRYRKLFENAHDAIWLQDMEGNIITANEASSKMTGYDLKQLIGTNVKTFLPEASLKIAREIRQKLLRGETIEDAYEQQFKKKDGTEVYLRLSTSLVTENGQPVAFQHIARDYTTEKGMQENLKYYLKEATEAQEEERKRISRELHDETIQELVVLSRQLDMLASKSKDLTDADRQFVEKLQRDTVEIMRGVRRLSQDLRPAALDRLGLMPALEWLVANVKEYSGIEIETKTTGENRRLSELEELILFRVTQEALRNAWHHSGASKVTVHIEFTTITVRIVVSDNGKGFIPPKSISDLAKAGKLGLAGMQERVKLIGGEMKVKSRPGKGTDITVELITDPKLK